MKFIKNNLLLIIVDVSASTEAFVRTVCLVAVRRSVSGRTGCRRRLASASSYFNIPRAPDQTVAQMWSNGVRWGSATTNCLPWNWAANGD